MNTDTHPLERKRAALEAELRAKRLPPEIGDLVRRADQAVASYREETEALQRQIDDIDNQVGAREIDRRAAANKAHQERVAASRAALAGEIEALLTAVADAQAATWALTDALNRTFVGREKVARLEQVLAPERRNRAVTNPMEMAKRMAGRISAMMGTQIVGHRARLGEIEWPSTAGLYPPDQSWSEDEATRLAGLQPLITGKA